MSDQIITLEATALLPDESPPRKPVPPEVPRRANLAAAILVVGGFIYVLLCGPAIGCRGYPPIDPIWYGIAFTFWPAPVMLSAVFDSYKFRGRHYGLLAYALVTAFFDAGTPIMIVPRQVNPLEMLFFTVLIFGPLHLFVTVLLERLLQFLLRRQRTLSENVPIVSAVPKISLYEWFVAYTAVCIAIGGPLAFREFDIDRRRARGVERADADWKNNQVELRMENETVQVGDATVEYHVDRETGLKRKTPCATPVFCNAYNARIRELIRVNGLPTGSLRSDVPTPDELVALLDATDLQEVTQFPYQLTPQVILMRGGTATFGSATYSNGGQGLAIASEQNGMHCVGSKNLPVFVETRANVFVVRSGNEWVGMIDASGCQIAEAYRFN